MFNKNQVELAHKFYSAQKTMKFLHGDKYDDKIAEARKVIEGVASDIKCDVITATKVCIEKIIEIFPYDNGIMVAMLLATCVEICEGD